MQAFFCPDQLLHTPQQFMRPGRLHQPADVPVRAEPGPEVLGVDAHHGDGTQQIVYDRGDVLTVSTHADPDHDHDHPFYSGRSDERGNGAGLGCNLNLPLAHGSGNADFIRALGAGVAAVRAHAPAALVLCMGFDTFHGDSMRVLKLDHDAYRAVGRRVRALGLPAVVVQEGGYMVEALGPGLQALLEGLGA